MQPLMTLFRLTSWWCLVLSITDELSLECVINKLALVTQTPNDEVLLRTVRGNRLSDISTYCLINFVVISYVTDGEHIEVCLFERISPHRNPRPLPVNRDGISPYALWTCVALTGAVHPVTLVVHKLITLTRRVWIPLKDRPLVKEVIVLGTLLTTRHR